MASDASHEIPPPGHNSPEQNENKSGVLASLIEIAHHYYIPHPHPHHQRHPSTDTTELKVNPERERLIQKYHKVRRWARIVSVVTHVITGVLSAVIESIMIYVLYKFYTTNDIYMVDRPWGPWAKQSVIWPTFMFAAAGLMTSLLAFGALVLLFTKSKRKIVAFSLAYVAVHILFWIIISIVYRVEKTEKDLWGWSCTTKAKAIQQQLGKDKIDFDSLCQLQGSSWAISITHIVVKVVSSAVSWYFDREQDGLKTDLLSDVGSQVFAQLTG